MNLPNFINFEPFNRLRRQMRTSQLGRFSIHGKDAADAMPVDSPAETDSVVAEDAVAPRQRTKAKAAKPKAPKSAAAVKPKKVTKPRAAKPKVAAASAAPAKAAKGKKPAAKAATPAAKTAARSRKTSK